MATAETREKVIDLLGYYGLDEYFDYSKGRSVYREDREEVIDAIVALIEVERMGLAKEVDAG